MKTLPYFRWYPADAKADEKYTGLTDAELGFYHRCLNHSWDNSGLPSDLNELARVMHVTRSYVDRLWPRVGRLFYEEDARLFSKRLEKERQKAISTSENNKRDGNANATRQKRERVSNAPQHAQARAESESESVSETTSELTTKTSTRAENAEGWLEWWTAWSRIRGTNHENAACHAYFSVVPAALRSQCFECVCSYLASLENHAKGYNPENFLFEQARDGFKARWPKYAPRNGRSSFTDDVEAVIQTNVERTGRPW